MRILPLVKQLVLGCGGLAIDASVFADSVDDLYFASCHMFGSITDLLRSYATLIEIPRVYPMPDEARLYRASNFEEHDPRLDELDRMMQDHLI